ncbi:MAG: hypothetical protein R6U44_03215 [Archaeoglobaceae archaeon]
MRTGHLVLIMVALFTMGMVVLPTTVSLLAGQHTFYEVNEGYESRCVKCHADIYEELKGGSNHSTVDGQSGFSGKECLGCHRANVTITYANASIDQPGEEAHAATTTYCGYCHFDQNNNFDAPIAGGFGLSNLQPDTGIYASHNSFVIQSKKEKMVSNYSESCIACHTNCNVEINFNTTVKSRVSVKNTVNGWEFDSIQPTGFDSYTEEKN